MFSMSEDLEFRPVTRKKWIANRNRNKRLLQQFAAQASTNEDGPAPVVEKIVERLSAACTQMSSCAYFQDAMTVIDGMLLGRQCEQLVCLGIGPFSSSYHAFHQLAFVLSAIKHCQIPEAHFFDPVLSCADKEVLRRRNCKVMPENCMGKYQADRLTLFYMPHCPNALTNNLLWQNWSPSGLQNILLVSNSFADLLSNKPPSALKLEAQYILDIVEYTTERPLADTYSIDSIFNNLSAHMFPMANLPSEKAEFWAKREAPVYEADTGFGMESLTV